MPSKIYNWKRFWCPREGSINLGNSGFLYDPDDQYGKALNPDLVTLKDIIDVPCLVLLGEPGIGKSTTIKTQKEYLDKQVQENGGKTLWFDLRNYQTDIMLKEEIFKDPVYLDWLNNDYNLYLYLDSLDECLQQIKTVSAFLSEKFKKRPDKKCFLRIACRTAVWPQTFEEELKDHWVKENVKVYELAPLRHVDVENAAKENGIPQDEFMKGVIDAEAGPFASKPVTLNFLLNIFKREGRLPPRKIEIYQKGCRILCEKSQERKEKGIKVKLTADQRLMVASRIAAITIFSKKDAVWKGIDEGNVPKDDISEIDISGGFEIVKGENVSVDEAAISETLDTGLFNSRGPNRMGWAHQTYPEFLAANYLCSHNTPLNQIMSLITHPNGKLIPQLHETSAWIASMRNDVFQEIMNIEPEILLQSDVAGADEDSRKELTAGLLRIFDEGIAGDNYFTYKSYRKLKHKSLAEQLKPYMCDKGKNFIVRRTAIEIASYCEETNLLPEIIGIAFDKSEPVHFRDNAANAIAKIGDKELKLKLMPLAKGEAGDDPDDELKVIALSALWPDHISSHELFSMLTKPKNSHFIGSYYMFISHELAKQLKQNDLPDALKWVEEHVPTNRIHDPFEKLSESIMKLAYENLDFPGVLDPFVKAVYSWLKEYDEYLGALFSENEEKRRRVILHIIPLFSNPDDALRMIFRKIVLPSDFSWLIELFLSADADQAKRSFLNLIRYLFDYNPQRMNEIFVACEKSEILRKTFSFFIDPVQLDSPEAQRAKEEYYEYQELMQNRKRELLVPPPEERILQRLNLFESGELMAFWELTMELTLEPDSTHYGSNFEPFVINLPGWKKADKNIKARILNASKKYVIDGNPSSEEWIGSDKINCSAMAGYKALLLLLTEERSFLDNIPSEIWKKWAPTILAYLTGSGSDEDKYYQALVEKAYIHASDEIINTLLILIDKENEKYDNLFILRKVENCWDEKMKSNLFKKIKDKRLKPKCWNHLLKKLFKHNVAGVREYADSLIFVPPPSCGDNRLKMRFSLHLLFIYYGRTVWPTISYIVHEDRNFGRELIEMIASEDRSYGTSQKTFLEEQLSELYIWIHKEYPDVEKENLNGFMTVPNYIADFKNGIINHLAARGTFEACDAISRIMKEFPELDWLKRTLGDAEKNARRGTWTPLKPNELLELVRDRKKRVIHTGDDLLNAIIESLEKLEKEILHGDIPAVEDIWDKNIPKDEKKFSDYITRYLRENLKDKPIIVNREVEIHQGDKTDIQIDAIIVDPQSQNIANKITAIIECKGCWNKKEIETAMETQLINKYLADNICKHGLYLIGCFCCDCWDNEDYKKKDALKHEGLEKARGKYITQAKELSEKYRMDIRAFVLDCSRH